MSSRRWPVAASASARRCRIEVHRRACAGHFGGSSRRVRACAKKPGSSHVGSIHAAHGHCMQVALDKFADGHILSQLLGTAATRSAVAYKRHTSTAISCSSSRIPAAAISSKHDAPRIATARRHASLRAARAVQAVTRCAQRCNHTNEGMRPGTRACASARRSGRRRNITWRTSRSPSSRAGATSAASPWALVHANWRRRPLLNKEAIQTALKVLAGNGVKTCGGAGARRRQHAGRVREEETKQTARSS